MGVNGCGCAGWVCGAEWVTVHTLARLLIAVAAFDLQRPSGQPAP